MQLFISTFVFWCTLHLCATMNGVLEDLVRSHFNQSQYSFDSHTNSSSSTNSNLDELNKSTEDNFTSMVKTALTTDEMEELTKIFDNSTESTSDEQYTSSSASLPSSSSQTISGRRSTTFFPSTSTSFFSTSSPTSEETDVVLATKKPIPMPKTIIQKTIEWMSDTYTLSIVIPIAAGIVFASTMIVTIAACNCMRRRCRRRRLRRKVLPDSVKNMRASDRARLLAESSDDEF